VLGRDAVSDTSKRPLLAARWSAAVDTVGGDILATLLRSTMHRGCVTACGLVAGHDLRLTVYPFILRGVTLAGIDSANCPMDRRRQIWERLAGDWKLDDLEGLAATVRLDEIDERVEQILSGRVAGRTVVVPTVD
jgi:putative YhdH/YhfP family quinone oxidoreductase